MKRKTVLLMIVAIACGLTASYLIHGFIAEHGDPEKVGVLVAKHDITTGTLITSPESLFMEKQYLKGEEPKRAVRSFDELKGRRLNRPVSEDQFVTAEDLEDKHKDDLAGRMPKGMRAVALKTTAESQVAGFVQPQSHVDIISAIPNSNGGITSKTILRNILVLAVDQRPERPDDRPAVVASTVTVLVTPVQAEQLAAVQRTGTISLSLRPFDDETEIAAPSMEVPKAPLEPGEVQPRPCKSHTLDIYDGYKLTRTTFLLNE